MTAVVRTLGAVDLLDYTKYRTPDAAHNIQHHYSQSAYAHRGGGFAHTFTRSAGDTIALHIICVANGSEQNAEDAKQAVLDQIDLAQQHNNELVAPVYYTYQFGDMTTSHIYQILTCEDVTENLPPGVGDIELVLNLKGNQIQ